MPTYNVTAITLSAHKYGDAARVVSFLTPERGKIEAVARGIGKPGSKLAAAVEPFTISRLQLVEGRGMDRLAQAEVIEAHFALRNDMHRYAYAATLLELTELTMEPGAALPGLFEELSTALGAITGGTDPETVLWAFALRLLHSHGNAPVTSSCVRCGGAVAGEVCYLPAEGGFACRDCRQLHAGQGRVSGAVVGALRGLGTLPMDRLDRLRLAPEVRRDVNRVVRSHIAYHVTDELRSMRFLDKMTRSSYGAGPIAEADGDDQQR